MKKHLVKMGATIAAAFALILASFVPALAQDTYTAINGDDTSVTLNKTLDLGDSEYGPTHTATFTTTYVDNMLEGATQDATGVPPVITLSFDTTGAAQTDTLDFTGVSFPAPGIYRFQVEETAISDPAVTPVSGSEASYFIDVYVTNVVTATGQSTLQIDKYNILTGSAEAKETSADFENEYTSFKLDVAKTVTGNQGDKTKEFTFTVTFSDGKAGDKYAVRWAAGTPKVNGSAITETSEPVEVAANGTVTLKLKDTDQVEFYGIPSGVKYTVVETESGQDGYTTTGEVTTAKALTEDKTETVVNNKQGVIPTGIFINYMPYWVMGGAVLALIVVFARKRENSYDEI